MVGLDEYKQRDVPPSGGWKVSTQMWLSTFSKPKCPPWCTAWNVHAGTGIDSTVVLKTSSTIAGSNFTAAHAAEVGQRPQPDLFQPSTHSSQMPTHRPGWCSASKSSRPFLTPLWQILLLTITWASAKSDSNEDNEQRCLRSKKSCLHPHCKGSVSFHGAMRTGAISTDFCILYVPHYPRALFYFLLLEPNFMWYTSTCISTSSTKHLNLQVSSAPHCALKTCCWCPRLPLPHCIAWGYFWNSCPLPQPGGKLISASCIQKWGPNTTAWHSLTTSIIFQYWALRTPLSWKSCVLLMLLCRFSKIVENKN